MTQPERISKVLSRNTKGAGITAARLAKLAKVSPSNIYKRVSELRDAGFVIHKNYRTVNGKRMVYYRMPNAA
jgi:Mn-dependent DtxR family transcriptional regulator